MLKSCSRQNPIGSTDFLPPPPKKKKKINNNKIKRVTRE